jgi:hypothetical protein
MVSTWAGSTTATPVTYEFEVAFDADPWDAAPVYTSLSSRVREVVSFRGASSVLSEPGPGSMEVVLGNRDRFLDPHFAAGPWFGKLLPMKPARLKLVSGAVTLTVLSGWVTGWPQDWVKGDASVRVTVVEQVPAIAGATLPASAYQVEVLADNPVGYWPLQVDGAATIGPDLQPSDRLGGQTAFTSVAGTYPLGQSSGLTGQDSDILEIVNTGWFEPLAIEAWVTVSGAGGDGSVWFGAAQAIGTYLYVLVDSSGNLSIGYSNDTDNDYIVYNLYWGVLGSGSHHVVVFSDGTDLKWMVDGSVVGSVALLFGVGGDPPSFGGEYQKARVHWNVTGSQPLARLSHFAVYESVPSIARFEAHYQAGRWAWSGSHGDYGWEYGGARITRILDDIGHPAALRDLSPGGTLQAPYLPGSGSAIEAIREVVNSEAGLLTFDVAGKVVFRDRQWLWMTADAVDPIFSDDGANVKYSEGSPDANMVDRVSNVITATWAQGGITRRDETSITRYRERPLTIQSDTISDAQDASNRAAYELRDVAAPKSVIRSLTIKMRGNIAAYFTAIAALDTGRVVTVERTPMQLGPQIVSRHSILGFGHELYRTEWYVTLYLAPAVEMADEAPYLTVAHATDGKVGAANLNGSPF